MEPKIIIESVNINGFLSFYDFSISLHKNENIIVGTNGCDKTNFLMLLKLVLCDNSDELLKYVNKNCKTNKYISINLKLNTKLVNEYIMIHIIEEYINSFGGLSNYEIKKIIDKIRDHKMSKSSMTIKYYYHNSKPNCELRRDILISDCTCTNQYNYSSDIYGHNNDDCYMKQINEYLKTKSTIINLDYDRSIMRVYLLKVLKEYDILTDELTNDIEYNGNNNHVLDNDPFDVIYKYIKSNLTFIFLPRYKHPSEIQNIINNSNDKMTQLNELYDIRKKLYKIKNGQYKKFRIITEEFKNITGKTFDIIVHDLNNPHDYEYVIINEINDINDEFFHCSNGEVNLINFICEYYINDSSCIIADEPCSNLSSQNKVNFRNKYLSESKKQMIIVTHDIEMLNNNCNIIYFRMSNNTTEGITINFDEKDKKNLYEHKEILFSSKCLLVEGYHDYKFIKAFLEIYDIKDYNLIVLDGEGNKIWKILDRLKIEHKIIYDADVLFELTDPKKLKKKSVRQTNKYKILHKLMNDIIESNNIKHIGNNIDHEKKKYNDFMNEYMNNNLMVYYNRFIWGNIFVDCHIMLNDIGKIDGDIEHVGRLIIDTNMSKDKWHSISNEMIRSCIEKKKNHKLLCQLEIFLRS